jgi:hypothetical protein
VDEGVDVKECLREGERFNYNQMWIIRCGALNVESGGAGSFAGFIIHGSLMCRRQRSPSPAELLTRLIK